MFVIANCSNLRVSATSKLALRTLNCDERSAMPLILVLRMFSLLEEADVILFVISSLVGEVFGCWVSSLRWIFEVSFCGEA